MAFWPVSSQQQPPANSISLSYLADTQLPFSLAMDPPFPPSSSSSSPYAFSLDFQRPWQQQQPPPPSPWEEQQQQQSTPSPRPLQGPRPSRLKVDKKSQKIKKPPLGPAFAGAAAAAPPPQPQPVIIYTVSPKVIRTKPSDFMALVQRLTGVNSSADAVSPPAFPSPGGAPSPAARLAAIDKATRLPDHLCPPGGEIDPDRPVLFGGILSPNPASLPPVSPGLFSAPAPPEFTSPGFHPDMLGLLSPSGGLSPLGLPTPQYHPLWEFLMNSPQSLFPFPPPDL